MDSTAVRSSKRQIKGFGDSTGCGWMQGILGLSDSGDRCLEGGPRVEAIFDVGDARLGLASRFAPVFLSFKKIRAVPIETSIVCWY